MFGCFIQNSCGNFGWTFTRSLTAYDHSLHRHCSYGVKCIFRHLPISRHRQVNAFSYIIFVRFLKLFSCVSVTFVNWCVAFCSIAQSSLVWVMIYSKTPSIKLQNFVPFWQPLCEIPASKFRRFRRRRDRQQNVKWYRLGIPCGQTCASVKDWCMSLHVSRDPRPKFTSFGNNCRLATPLTCRISPLSHVKCARYLLPRKWNKAHKNPLRPIRHQCPSLCKISSRSAKRCTRNAVQLLHPSVSWRPGVFQRANVHQIRQNYGEAIGVSSSWISIKM